ncbi:MAG: PQQ-dependent dehydrogenase, methanol/ethanol family [Gammaproteobacteria bacterium]
MRITLPAGALALALTVAPVCAATLVDDAALANPDQGGNWLGYGRTHSEQRFSPLDQIDAGNIARLGIAWSLDLPNERSLTATPLVVDGVMYFNGSFSRTFAVDARTGKMLWQFDPKTVEHAGDRAAIIWDWNRGIAYWKGKVFIATGDGRLIAVDAKNGRQVWSQQTFDPKLPLFVSGAPRVFRDKVIIGNGGTEWGAARGFVTAYDTETGKQAWRFYTVPGNPADGFEDAAQEMAAKTWTGEWWKHGGGGTVWHGITYDPEFNRVYIGTGNGSPWNQKMRSPGGGDNLFLCSIVALDADTGEYAWHYQTTPGETWDYNSNMDIVLADLTIDGKPVKALMHAPKNGFFYVIDRATGKFISARPFGKVDWATGIDANGRPVERVGARYEDGEELVWPGPFGTHNWPAMSFNPDTGLVYIPAIEMAGMFNDRYTKPKAWQSPNFKFDPGVDFLREDGPADWGSSALRAWDPVRQKLAWEVPTPGVWNAGTLTTRGNWVMQGRADGKLVAYQADNGKVLWETSLGLGISAPPITYALDGQQYVAQLVGWGGSMTATGGAMAAQHGWAYRVQPRRLVVFALDGQQKLPAMPPPTFAKPLPEPEFAVYDELAERGSFVWKESCGMCHGPAGTAGGYAPDLRASKVFTDDKLLHQIVFDGTRRELGMPNFKDITPDDLKAVQHFVRREARKQGIAP